MASAMLFSKWADGMPLNEMHNNSFSFQMKNANEYASMKILLCFQNKWLKMKKRNTKIPAPTASINTQAKNDTKP